MPAPTPVNVPIVDFSACSMEKPLDIENKEVLRTIDVVIRELQDYGCVYITNHGLTIDDVQKLRTTSRQFFSLPVREKMKSIRKSEDPKNGWVAEEMEYFNEERAGDLKECFNMSYSDIDNFPWPDDDSVPEFKETNRIFIKKLIELAKRLFILLGLKLSPENPDIFTKAHENFETDPKNNFTCLRNLYYPPLSHYAGTKLAPEQMRCSAHSDFGIFTFLIQDSVGGLEVQGRDGEWFEARPLEGAILMQAADMLERWTAGRIMATVHRVGIPVDEERRERVRESTAFFVMPNQDFLIKCLDGSDKYPPMSVADYVMHKMDLIQGKNEEVKEMLEKKM